MTVLSPLRAEKAAALKGTARIPGDKSMSHRAMMFGALAAGTTTIDGLLEGEDVLATAAAMRAMGAKIEKDHNGQWHIEGVGSDGLREPDDVLDMGNSGTSTRLLAGIIAGHDWTATMTGDASLRKRPMKRIRTPLEEMGAVFLARSGDRLPLTLQGSAALRAISYHLPVASAQVKSAVLLAGLRARGTTTVVEDKPTRDHTENMLRAFGVDVRTVRRDDGAYEISLQGGQTMASCHVDIPADPSSAAFPAVAALLVEGSDVHLPGIGMNERRAGLYETLRAMGGAISYERERHEAGEAVADLHIRGTGPLTGITVPEERVPAMIDEFPVLAMAAACAQGTTHMTGLAELRVKESDRLLLTARGLKACGVDLEMGEDWLTIHGTGQAPRGGVTIATALDHRIAMSFLVLGLVTDAPVTVDDATPIATSFPDFVDLMGALGTAFRA